MQPDITGELVLTAMHPDVTFEQIQQQTGWPLRQSADCSLTQPPKVDELRILREELDPQKIYI
jgi:glutaconate CoA-transferase subunit B